MPIVQNINEENILFINDEIFKTFNTEEFNNIITIKNNNDEKFTVLFNYLYLPFVKLSVACFYQVLILLLLFPNE